MPGGSCLGTSIFAGTILGAFAVLCCHRRTEVIGGANAATRKPTAEKCVFACANYVNRQCLKEFVLADRYADEMQDALDRAIEAHDHRAVRDLREAFKDAIMKVDRLGESQASCREDRPAQDACVKKCLEHWSAAVAGCVANAETFDRLDPCFAGQAADSK